MYLDRTACL
uniref:Uncharacterized protein n=1 Tax=Arundo donax TaxID=35708 RepID=A0A0A8Y0M9_ARUDO